QHLLRMERDASEEKRILPDLDKRLALVARDVERLERRFDELLTRRWDLWKLVLAAFLGSLLTVAAGFLSRSLDRWIGVGPARVGFTDPTSIDAGVMAVVGDFFPRTSTLSAAHPQPRLPLQPVASPRPPSTP